MTDNDARLLQAGELGLVRAAEGRNEEAGTLLDRAVALAPDDRFVLYHASSVGTVT